jgi:hypothetical protein
MGFVERYLCRFCINLSQHLAPSSEGAAEHREAEDVRRFYHRIGNRAQKNTIHTLV